METFPTEYLPALASEVVKTFRDTTEAPDEFLAAGTLFAAGVLAGRWVTFNGQCLNNYYLILGPTGTAKKSTAQNLSIDLLRRAIESRPALFYRQETAEGDDPLDGCPEAYPLVTHFSVEGLQQHAIGTGTSTAVTIPEYGAIFDIGKRQGQKNTITELTSLYDGGSLNVRTITRRVQAKDFSLSILGASTESWIADLMSDKNIAGGFVNRHLLICGVPSRIIPSPVQISNGALDLLAEKLAILIPPFLIATEQEGRIVWNGNRRSLQWSADARTVWTHYYTERTKTLRLLNNERLSEIGARELPHATKLAGLRCYMEQRDEVSIGDLIFGVQLSRWSTRNTIDLSRRSEGPSDRDENALLRKLHTYQPITKRELAQKIGGKQEGVNRSLNALEAKGWISKNTDGLYFVPSGPNNTPELVDKYFGKTGICELSEKLVLGTKKSGPAVSSQLWSTSISTNLESRPGHG